MSKEKVKFISIFAVLLSFACSTYLYPTVATLESKVDVIDAEVGDLSDYVQESFAGTWTAIERIDTKVFAMNDEILTIESKIDVIDTEVGNLSDYTQESFVGTWTAIAVVGCGLTTIESKIDVVDAEVDTLTTAISDCCSEIPVKNSDAVSGIITLSVPGHYRVVEPIANKIVISVDDVCLDLHCYKISFTNANDNIITVNSGLENIRIFNGSVCDTSGSTGTGSGILLNSGVSRIFIEKIRICDCGNGVKLDGQDGNEVIECKLIALDLVSNITGLVLSHADENVTKDCRAFHNTQAGFELLNSEANCFYDCQALKTFGEQSTMGFTSRSGQSNLFQRCVAKKTKTSAFEFCNKAHGFLLTGTEEKTKIIDCIVNATDVTSTVSAIAYGIHLAPILLGDGDLINGAIAGDDAASAIVRSVAWSPSSNYIASGDDGNFVRVFRLEGKTLTHIDDDPAPTGDVVSVVWSPDGKYIASGDLGGFVRVFSFDGANLTFIDSSLTSFPDFIRSVAWSPDGKYIASGDDSNFVSVFSFDGTSLSFIDDDSAPVGPALSVAWSPDGKYIASGDNDTNVKVFSFDGANLISAASNSTPTGAVNSVVWSPDGNSIASGDAGGSVGVFRFNGTNLLTLIDSNSVPTGVVASVAWSPDGKYIVCGDDDGLVYVFRFNGATITLIASDLTEPNLVFSVAWSSGGNYIATGNSNNFVLVFDAMFGPEDCLVQECTVGDTEAYDQFVGTGIAGGGNNCFVSNVCCNNEVNYTYGIPNVFYGEHNIERNTVRPFDNISIPTTQ